MTLRLNENYSKVITLGINYHSYYSTCFFFFIFIFFFYSVYVINGESLKKRHNTKFDVVLDINVFFFNYSVFKIVNKLSYKIYNIYIIILTIFINIIIR